MKRPRLSPLLLLLPLAQGCDMHPPAAPSSGPTKPGQAALAPLLLEPLPLPSRPPFDAWTRTAPITLVNERGEGVQVLAGHHTRLAVDALLDVRALVRCVGCRTPVEGWIQREMLLPARWEGTPGERSERRLSIALLAAFLRDEAEGGRLPKQAETAGIPAEVFLSLLDQGFREEALAPYAPPWAAESAFEGWVLTLAPQGEGWRLDRIERRIRPTP